MTSEPLFTEGDKVKVDHIMKSEFDEYNGKTGEVVEVTPMDDDTFKYDVEFSDGRVLSYLDMELHRV